MGVYLFFASFATKLHFFLGVFLHFITGADTDGYFANMEDLHLAVINAAKKNLAVQFKQIESEVDALYNAKRQECNAFLENLDDVIESEIRRIDELTEKAARHQLDLDNNQRCKKWMEDVMRRLDAVIQFQT